ncbi:MAG: NmrA/HSCARG family protein [Pseudomonadota bacterium]
MTKTIALIGGTGAMGRAVVNALLRDDAEAWHVRLLTRDPQSARAQAMKTAGGDRITFVAGDLEDGTGLDEVMKDAYGAFSNTNFWTVGEKSVARERTHGLRVLEAAARAGVELFVHSSLDAATNLSDGAVPVPHYDAKASVEHEIDWRRSDEFFRQDHDGWYSKHAAVLVTEPYIENFQSIFLPEEGKLSDGREGLIFRGPLAGDAPWPMVALDDIGAFARIMFSDPGGWGGRTLRIGSDNPTLPEAVATFEKVTGIPAEFAAPSDEDFLASDMPNAHDVLNNFLFHRKRLSAPRDYAALRDIHPGLRSFESWLRENGWRGGAGDVQKDAISGE